MRSAGDRPRALRGAAGLLIALSLAACAPAVRYGPAGSAEGDYLRAQQEYERGHYVSAVELLENFERVHPGSQYIDDALFLLGRSHQGNREFILAREVFGRLREDFPQSPHAEEALFQIAHSWFLSVRGPALDPEPAEEALRSLRVYLRRYPEGAFRAAALEAERSMLGVLAAKAYENGLTYLRLKRWEAARRSFERSLTEWDASPHSALALAGIARCREEEGDGQAAREAYRRLLDHLGDDPGRYREGEKLAREAQRKLVALGETTGS